MKNITVLTMILSVVTACGPMQSADLTSTSVATKDAIPDSAGSLAPSPMPAITPSASVPIAEPQKAATLEPLVWESAKKPERKAWSAELIRIVGNHFVDLDRARDMEKFCPSYRKGTREQRIHAWANLIASVTYYESSWNPASYSVDVGTKNNPDTWSVGLLQMSVVDQANYRLKFGYKFADLQKATPNLELGMAIMAKQIIRTGLIAIPVGGKGLYWAVLHPGGRYDKTASIAKMAGKIQTCR